MRSNTLKLLMILLSITAILSFSGCGKSEGKTGERSLDSLLFTVPDDISPVAIAGEDQTLLQGEPVTLDGSKSVDEDGEIVSYRWELRDGTYLGEGITLTTDLSLPLGTYEIVLIVTDDKGATGIDTVVITVVAAPPKPPVPENKPPVANAGANQSDVAIGSTVTLDGSGSSDPDGDTLTYKWTMTAKPTGSGAVLSDSTIVKPKFTADKAGSYTVQLIVNDGKVNSVPYDVEITAKAAEAKSTLKKTGQTTEYTPYDDGYYHTGVDPSYTRNSDVVKDLITGLEWQDDVAAATVTKTWAEAGPYCAALSLDGGGWRLPTIDELVYITDKSKFDPAINAVFQNKVSSNYWSSTTVASDTGNAWGVNFYYGNDHWYYKSVSSYVRCVRAGQ